LHAVFNFRFGTASTAASLRERTEAILRRHGVALGENASRIDWWLSGEPFATPAGPLRGATLAAIREQCGVEPELSTGGGTSDGRFIAPLGAEVVELGVCNASIHKVDEHVALEELERLPMLYGAVIERFARSSGGK
jgi:succinyl-diaminopimelate desuccinylase